MSNKSRGALCGGCYITRLVKNLGVFNALTGLHGSCHTIELAMDTFRSMHLVEKRGDTYVLIDGIPPSEGVPKVAKGHDSPVPDILASEILLVLPADVLAQIKAAQQR